MKHVILVYRSYENYQAVDFIKANLEEVFEENIQFTNCFLHDLKEGTQLEADAFLAVDEYIYQELSSYVKDFRRVIRINRSPDRSAIKKIAQIPAGETVLVVNDSYISSRDTVNSFFELGISHINMIPFDENLAHTNIYDHVQIAITPAEPHLVPPHIKQIIDIGYRPVSFDTLFKLMRLLDLDVNALNRNLFLHMQHIVESSDAFHSNYIYGYLKEEMLNRVVSDSKVGMILTDYRYQVIYVNDRALQIFHVGDKNDIRLNEYLDLSVASPISQGIWTINDACYDYNIYPITLKEEITGYYITLRSETDQSTVSRINQKKGYIAKYHFNDIIHDSVEMKRIIRSAKQIAVTDHTILIRGESGTGKELIAQSIHNASLRNKAPFVAVNCAALPETLLESELFGYEGGAFTGADSKGKVGLFEQANHGTIFLDEIGDISPKMQAQLLRTIQEKQIMRVGSDRLIDVDIRLITATNRNLENAVKSGDFRNDLFYRLNVLSVVLPPLRNRKEDIPALMKYFLGNTYRNLTTEERNVLMSYDWPGNVRELENAAVYYTALSSLPEYLYYNVREMPQSLMETADAELKCHILALIHTHSTASHGVGRLALLKLLKQDDIIASDFKLRAILSELEARGYIRITKGRGGTHLTEKGLEFLRSQ